MDNSGTRTIIFSLSLLFIFCLLKPSYALDIRKRSLDNGLRVLQVERHNLPIVIMTLLIKASPLNEPPDKAGTAHLTSRLLTEGTVSRKGPEISEEVEFMGASLEASANSDFTTISLSVLKKDLAKGLDLFSDVLLNPSFPEDELQRKKELLRGSLKQREEDPLFTAGKAFRKAVFGDHPYGRLVEGDAESIARITRDDVVNFYRRHYIPAGAVLSVVGDLTPEELDTLVLKRLGGWKAEHREGTAPDLPTVGGAPPAKRSAAVESGPSRSGKQKTVVIIDRDITQASIVLGNAGISRENPDYYAVTVMNYILGGGGFASRLMRSVRDEMGLAYSIFSSFAANKEPGQFEVEVQTKNEAAGTVIKEVENQIRRIRTEPVAGRELEDAKAYLTGSFPRRLETSRRIADFLTAVQFYNLGDDYIDKYPGYINGVTKEDVLRVAQKYLEPVNYVLVIAGKREKMTLTDLKPSEDIH